MGILGIENRTENWKTARTFAPFLKDNIRRRKLAKRLSGAENPRGEVHIEFFWKGIRDWLHLKGKDGVDYASYFTDRYNSLFPNLCEEIKNFDLFQEPKAHNYHASSGDEEALYRNLLNTEIDIVLESKTHLFIGEAKHEMTFNANSDLVLVHQLIRQYVMASILVDCLKSESREHDKEIISFVVGDKDKIPSLQNTAQVTFMFKQKWLSKDNVLSWDEIDRLAEATT